MLPAREGAVFTYLMVSQRGAVRSVAPEPVNSSVLRTWPLPRSGRGPLFNLGESRVATLCGDEPRLSSSLARHGVVQSSTLTALT